MEIEDLIEIMEVDMQGLTKEFNRVRSMDDPRKRQAGLMALLANDNKLFKAANDHIGDYNSTLRELEDNEAEEMKGPLQDFQQKIRVMKENVKILLDEANKELLLAKPVDVMQPETAQTMDERARGVIQKTEAVQGKTIDAIGRMENTIAETEVIGINVVDKLGQQGEKLTQIEEDLIDIREDIADSRQLIKAIQKELQKDKCWRLLVFIVLLIGLILVIWASVDKNFGHASKNAGGDGMSSSSDRCQTCSSSTGVSGGPPPS